MNRGHFPSDEAVIKLLWLAICDIEDKRARERDKEKGLPASKRRAKGKLVEGQITTDQIQGPGPAHHRLPRPNQPLPVKRLHRKLDRPSQALEVRAALEPSGLDHGPISVHDKMASMGLKAPSLAWLARLSGDQRVARSEPSKRPRAAWRRFVYPAPNACRQ